VSGPLAGVRVVELAGIGPGPFAAMMLADMGADVVRVDRAADVGAPSGPAGIAGLRPPAPGTGSAPAGPHPDVVRRGRRSIGVDVKHPDGRQVVLDLAARSDALLEAFRPGVAERLGLGPDDCRAVNPRLVYGRMTGWGQQGPLATTAGHDIGYIALTGALHGSRRAGERPVPPMNLLGDMGGGAMMLAFGVVCALLEAGRSGRGQVVDASIVDGTAALATFVLGLRNQGAWPAPAGRNLLDTGAPFYEVYTCADGREVAVGALEPKFYAELLRLSGMDDHPELAPERRMDPTTWAAAKHRWAELFASRTRDEWATVFEGSDACVAPVLDWDEAPRHPHLAARETYVERDGAVQSAPAPRFDRTQATLGLPPPHPGDHTDALLAELGHPPERIAALRAGRAVA
jgi:alpha-methylacyl-CoA racemase